MQNYKLKIKNLLIISIIGLIFIPTFVFGAVLYFEPSAGQYYQGDTFIIEARINTEDECINTVSADLKFSKEILEAIDFGKGDSILSLWVENPKIDQNSGLISFIGGIPGGYCGILPGDPGKTNLLGKIIFKVRELPPILTQSTAKVEFLDSSQVLLNDGFGTPAEISFKTANLTIFSGIPQTPKKEWQEELAKDDIPPEQFEIKISRDPSIFDGKYFIVFSTIDRQTGIDYYEINETPRNETPENLNWERGESPYLLEDQKLKSIIKVRAVDKAGNETISEFIPPAKPFPYWLIIIISLLVVVIIFILWFIKKSTNKNEGG